MTDRKTRQKLIEHLEQFASANKRRLIKRVLTERTRFITVVLEDIYQPHNASAVLRSCECFGIQDVHIIENRHAYRINPDVVMGSSKWLDLHRYRNPEADNSGNCIEQLKMQGYRIVATSLNEETISLPNLEIDKKTALFFGTEEDGLSRTVLDNADACLKIPMFGFTQSFNLSVSAAICLYELVGKMKREGDGWMLNEEEKEMIRLQWLQGIVKNSEIVTRQFLKNHSSIQE